MSFFSAKRTQHVDGPDLNDMKVTFENLCVQLHDTLYVDGVDSETLVGTFTDLYAWLTGTSNGSAIRLPAPVSDIDDKYRTMWPEGAKVSTRSRRDSHTSRTSSRRSSTAKVPKLDKDYTSSRTSNTINSRYAPVRTTFIEDVDPEQGMKQLNLRDIRNKQPIARPSIEAIQQVGGARRQPHVQRQKYDMDDLTEFIDTNRVSKDNNRRPETRRAQPTARKPQFIEDDE